MADFNPRQFSIQIVKSQYIPPSKVKPLTCHFGTSTWRTKKFYLIHPPAYVSWRVVKGNNAEQKCMFSRV